MTDWFSTLFNSDYGPAFIGGTNTIFFIVLFAFAVGHWVGFVYMWSHEAISYSGLSSLPWPCCRRSWPS